MRVAVLGMGRMGHALAERLLAGGHTLTVWNRTPDRASDLLAPYARRARPPPPAAAGGGPPLRCGNRPRARAGDLPARPARRAATPAQAAAGSDLTLTSLADDSAVRS